MNTPAQLYRFGPFVSRPRSRELHKYGSKLKIRPQPLQVLNLLLSRAGDVVTRESLRQELWSSETFVDFEHSLNTSVKELRAALGDSAAEPRYIETITKFGYRFIAPVEVIDQSGPNPVNDQASDPTTVLAAPAPLHDSSLAASASAPRAAAEKPALLPPPNTTPPLASGRGPALIGLALLLLAGFIADLRWGHSPAQPQAANSGRAVVAVLPFENLTGDPAQDYFSDGLTEEMITQLGRVNPERIAVIARTSVMHYKHTQEQLNQVGRELGVQYILEGSVRRDGEKVRITAQLIQTSDQTHIWTQQYDRELTSLLSLQSEIAQTSAHEIQHTLGDRTPTEVARTAETLAPKSYEAYDLYLKGRYFWNKRTADGFERAAECFNQAIARDPTYALAYAGLADTYTLMSAFDFAPSVEYVPKARAAAQKALQLDDKLAEAHASLAVIAQDYDWDWKTSEKEFRRAIELDPNYATGHHWYAENLAMQGRFDEAFPEIERARRLDPLSLMIQTDNAVFLYFSRQYKPAIQQFRAVLDADPSFPRAHLVMSAYVEDGNFADAIADAEKWRATNDSLWARMMLSYVYGRAGRIDNARREFTGGKKITAHVAVDPLPFAIASIGMNDKEQAFLWLEKAAAARSPALTAIKVDPVYDSLRSDPRFVALLARVGLAH
jgi:TolB-like protein/DNA-binding winged helix-turn-helix (wHTH) protein